MSDFNNLEIVRAISHSYRSTDGQELVHTQRQHQQEGTQHGDKQPISRPLSLEQGPIYLCCQIAFARGVKRSVGHAAEHRARPSGSIIRIRATETIGLLGHTVVTHDIALVDYLP